MTDQSEAARTHADIHADTELHELNRLAHEVARAALDLCQWLDYHGEEIEKWGPNEEAAHEKFHEAVVRYEEVDRRAQKEAAL